MDGWMDGYIQYTWPFRGLDGWIKLYNFITFFSEPVKKYGLSADEHFQFLKQFSDKTTPIDYDFLIK